MVGLTDAVQLALGIQHACALRRGGDVVCWGANSDGQLGDGTRVDHAAPAAVMGVSDATSIAAGPRHTCVVLRAGTVRCWGNNTHGELGNGSDATSSPTPVEVTGLSMGTGAGALGAIGSEYTGHTCAVRAPGDVRCWGYNANGQLGDGTTVDRRAPVAVVGIP